MISVTFIAADGRAQPVELEPGISLMEGAIVNGIEGIDAECGGNCYCGTCRIYVDPAWQAVVGTRNEFEAPILDAAGADDASARLSCQIAVTPELDGLVVTVPASQT